MKRLLTAAIFFLPSGLAGQAATYMEGYRDLFSLPAQAGQSAAADHLVLRRDAGELVLEQGTVYLLAPMGGRPVAAVFRGRGRFTFTPPTPAERDQLRRTLGSATLDDTISEAVLLFADSTPAQLRGLAFAPGPLPGDVADHVGDLLSSLKGDKEGAFNGEILGPLLSGETNGLFVARVQRAHGDPVLFRITPDLDEAVQLHRPVGKIRWGADWALVAEFPLAVPPPGSADTWRYRHRLGVPAYRLDVRLTPTGGGDLDFVASAVLTLAAAEPLGPWLRFGLHPKLVVDSARWEGGQTAAVTFKAKDDDDLWVRAPRRLQAGDSLTLTLFYRGNLIDRYQDWFYIDPGADWWPTNRQGRDLAMFDVTYHSPSWYPLASVGDRTDSSAEGKVMTTRWVTRLPTPFATFNLGLFENYHVQHPDAPPLDVLLSEDAHRLLRRQMLQQRNMRENVAADVSNSLKWFTHLFGEAPYRHFYVTEIPYYEGVSFPGLIDLSWATFQFTSIDGFDEFFRAHEVAHQWWGNGVRPASYRDAWLSEGLATFSALWYLQTLRKRNDEYFKFLDEYAGNIRSNRDAGPIWLGYRNATPDTPTAYQALIYEKGAWVFHMLRIMMLDLTTRKEDRFTEMMRDYYASYRGKAGTLEDLRTVVERHAGIPMGWFFDQWVKSTAIPTYHVAWTAEPADEGGGKYRARLRVTQENVPPDFQAWVLVSVDLGQNRFANFRVGVHGGQTEYVSPLLPAPPKALTFNELHSVLADVKMERW